MIGRILSQWRYTTAPGLGPFLLRSAAGGGAVQISAMFATFLVGIQLARGLDVGGYGEYAMAMAVVSLASVPGEFGFPRLIMRETAAACARKDWGELYGAIRWGDRLSGATAAVAGLAIAAGGVAFVAMSRPHLGWALIFGAPGVPLFALARVRDAALQGMLFVVRGHLATRVLRPVLLSAFLAVAWLFGQRVNSPLAMGLNSATAAIALMIAARWLRNRLPPHEAPAPVDHRRLLGGLFPMAAADGARTLQAQLTILILGVFAATTEVGLFRTAASITVMIAAPVNVIGLVASPTIARLFIEKDSRRLQKLLSHSALAQFAGVLLLSFPLLVAAPWFIRILFGPHFEGAAGPLRVVLFGQLVNGAFGLNVQLLNMAHKERRVTRAMLIALAVNIVTIVIFAPIWGKYGAAASFVISITVWNVITWLDAKRLLALDTSLWPVLRHSR